MPKPAICLNCGGRVAEVIKLGTFTSDSYICICRFCNLQFNHEEQNPIEHILNCDLIPYKLYICKCTANSKLSNFV
jgi:hypothetical protein